MREGEIACNRQFLLFLQCFLPHMALILHVKCTLKCSSQFVSYMDQSKILSFGKVLNNTMKSFIMDLGFFSITVQGLTQLV